MHLMHICEVMCRLYWYDEYEGSRWCSVEHTTLQMYSFSTLDVYETNLKEEKLLIFFDFKVV